MIKKNNCAILFILIFFYQTSYSQAYSPNNKWRLAKGTEGVLLAAMDVYLGDPDTIYAFGDKFLLSTDSGESWEIMPGPYTDIGTIKVDPFNSKTIYTSHYGIDYESNDISMTSDGGKTWKELFRGQVAPAPFIEIDPINKRRVYVVQGPEIIHSSTDHFKTWDTIDPNIGKMTSFAIAPSNSNVIYAGYYSKIVKTTDRGKNWTVLPFLFPFNASVSLAVDPYNADKIYAGIYSYGITPGGMYISTDGGQNWNEINNGLSSMDRDILGVYINPLNTGDVFIVTNTITIQGRNDTISVFRKANDNTWIAYNKGLPLGIRGLAFNTSKNKLYAYSTGIYILDSTLTSIERPLTVIKKFAMYQNFPNPFNNSTIIKYDIPEKALINLNVYDILGKEVKRLVYGLVEPGEYQVQFNASYLPSGVYFYKLNFGSNAIIRKALIIK